MTVSNTYPVLILGMHRSGTSCLTGQLEAAGLWLGEVKRKSEHNQKGNRENVDVMALNEDVLVANGGAWNRPPDGQVSWSLEEKRRRDQILDTYPEDRPWGLKDPRCLVTLNGWREALPKARMVGTVRHPLAVAKSLNARSGMSIASGLDLWGKYNRKLLDIARKENVPLVSFDADDAGYRRAVEKVARSLGLTTPPAEQDFFEPSLRHQTSKTAADVVELPADIMAVYNELCARTVE